MPKRRKQTGCSLDDLSSKEREAFMVIARSNRPFVSLDSIAFTVWPGIQDHAKLLSVALYTLIELANKSLTVGVVCESEVQYHLTPHGYRVYAEYLEELNGDRS